MPHETDPAQPPAVEVRTPARVHLGMVAFNVPESRSFGGVGVMVDRPGVRLLMRRANRLEARGPHAERIVRFARACMEAWGLGDVGCSLEVASAPGGHVGLGSGTQLGLAVAAGMRHLFTPAAARESSAPPLHPTEDPLEPADHDWLFDLPDAIALARATGRGRRSCVGVYGFSRGGLIVEAGRRVSPTELEDDATRAFSPMIARVRLPAAWRCVLVVARDALGLHGPAEKEAFAELPPVPAEITAELARIAMLELLPAAVEGKFGEFAEAVHRYGELAGKPFAAASSRLPHAAATTQLLELLGELGIVGRAQSSWGPAVMACCPTLDMAGDLVEALDRLGLAKHHDIVIARFDQRGAVLREVE